MPLRCELHRALAGKRPALRSTAAVWWPVDKDVCVCVRESKERAVREFV